VHRGHGRHDSHADGGRGDDAVHTPRHGRGTGPAP
jgi:hypothetical protein